MAGAGFKDFTVGEVLTSSDVDTYLMQQTVMNFADSAARGSALGTATGTAVPLAEGMVVYLQDTDKVEVYDGSAWVGLGGGFTASTAITATDASWAVPTLADPVVRVTVIGGGGGGSGGDNSDIYSGTDGSSSSFASSAGTAIAVGGDNQTTSGVNFNGAAGKDGWVTNNGGWGAGYLSASLAKGQGGSVTVAYFDLTGVSTASVTVGAGGAGANTPGFDGGAGGDGVVIVEYRAG